MKAKQVIVLASNGGIMVVDNTNHPSPQPHLKSASLKASIVRERKWLSNHLGCETQKEFIKLLNNKKT